MTKTKVDELMALAQQWVEARTKGDGGSSQQDALRSTLDAALKPGEPVGYVDGDDMSRRILWEPNIAAFDLPVGTKVYAAPQATPQAASEWLPISSAPKDGTWVLAINAKTNPSRQHVVRHYENAVRYPWKTGEGHMDWVAGITHWMPLHSAPKDTP